jgi:ATP-dependent RNA helicase DDX21
MDNQDDEMNDPDNSLVIKSEPVKEVPENLRFSSYRLTQPTIDALRKRGVEALFPIQAATFDLIYNGKDVLARAKVNK